MNNTHLYLSIGIPSFLVILAWLSNRADNQKMGYRIDKVQAEMNKGFETMRSEMIAFRREIHSDMVPLHERVAVMETRIEKK